MIFSAFPSIQPILMVSVGMNNEYDRLPASFHNFEQETANQFSRPYLLPCV